MEGFGIFVTALIAYAILAAVCLALRAPEQPDKRKGRIEG